MAWIALLFSISASVFGATEFKSFENIYISGTPTEQELADFKKEKGAAVLDLRAIDELGNCSEPAATAKLGLQYNRVNFEKAPVISRETVAGIDKVVADAGSRPVLLFCKTGNRAAAWLAIHLTRDKKMPLDEAIGAAKKLGLKDDMEKAVRAYLN